MTRSDIIKDFINSNMSIDIVLQNLLAILYCLDDNSLIDWAKQELSGYSHKANLPEYRKLKDILMASFMVGYVQYSKRPFSITYLDDKFRKKLLSVDMYSSISTLEAIKNNQGSIAGKPITPEYFLILQKGSNDNITSASVYVDLASINDIVSKIKTKILETLLFLEKEIGSLDELDIDISSKGEEEIKNIIQQIQLLIVKYKNGNIYACFFQINKK